MPPTIHTSIRGSTLTVKVSGPLDRRIASAIFSRFLSAKSGHDLIVDLTGVDEVYDTGLAALRLLRTRARQAGKRLAVVGSYQDDSLAPSPVLREVAHTPAPTVAGQPPWLMLPYAPAGGRPPAPRRPAVRPTRSSDSPRGSSPYAPAVCQPRGARMSEPGDFGDASQPVAQPRSGDRG